MIEKCVHCWNENDSKELSGIDYNLVGKAARQSTVEGTGVSAKLEFNGSWSERRVGDLVEFCNLKYPLKARCICRCHKEVYQKFWGKLWAGKLNFLRDEYFSNGANLKDNLFRFMRELCEDFFVPRDLYVDGIVDILGHPLTQDAIILRGQSAELYTLTHWSTGAPTYVDTKNAT